MNASKHGQHEIRTSDEKTSRNIISTRARRRFSEPLPASQARQQSSSYAITDKFSAIAPEKIVATNSSSSPADLICLSHLRWDFVYQRPQHLLSRCAQERRVFFFEEPVFQNQSMAWLDLSRREDGVTVAVPHLPEMLRDDASRIESAQHSLIDQLIEEQSISEYVLWYYTPMAMSFTRHLQPVATIYDCMDELSAFKNAPPALKAREAELFRRADMVFTGGQSLYEAKRDQHQSVYAFPSSIDTAHFSQARSISEEPLDQQFIPHPRMGFCGVIDERLDLELLDGVAAARPDWQFVMIGPVVKIEQESLPRRSNIHYLGGKNYKELPAYLSAWDVALMPFARNESTRFISPTKTPEYLAAGLPVVSTSIRDVVRPYEQQQMVHIADTISEFVAGIEAALSEDSVERIKRVDAFLAQNSWNKTWARMSELIDDAIAARRASTNSINASSPLRARAASAGATTDARVSQR